MKKVFSVLFVLIIASLTFISCEKDDEFQYEGTISWIDDGAEIKAFVNNYYDNNGINVPYELVLTDFVNKIEGTDTWYRVYTVNLDTDEVIVGYPVGQELAEETVHEWPGKLTPSYLVRSTDDGILYTNIKVVIAVDAYNGSTKLETDTIEILF